MWLADPSGRRTGRGFTLIEVMVAVVLLEVGLLGVAALFRLAAHELAEARLRQAAQWSVAAVADSVRSGRLPESGGRATAWGELTWAPSGAGILIEGRRSAESWREPLARVWVAVSVSLEAGS